MAAALPAPGKRTAKAKVPVKALAQPPVLSAPVNSVRGTRMIKFVEKYMVVPEGMLYGKPMVLLPEQKDFIHGVYDNVDPETRRLLTRRGIFSIARKNGKSGLISALLAGHLIGPEAVANTQLYSAARSRDQAAVVFSYLAKSLRLRSDLEGLVQITDSTKKVQGLAIGTEYKALSADAATKHGLSPKLNIHDELGQVIGPVDGLYDALETAGGAHAEPLSLIISTQAASDTDLLSIIIDDAIKNPTPENVVRLYAAAKDADIHDPKVWQAVNFALGKFRSLSEFQEAAGRAKRMSSFEPAFRNLYLNQRVSLLSLLVSPNVWAANSGAVDESLFTSGLPVHIGLDLSQSRDLTAAVLAVQDPETKVIHLKTFVFTPIATVQDRATLDRAPYDVWIREGSLIGLPGKVVSYPMVCQYLKDQLEGMHIEAVHFDRWRMDQFRKAAIDEDFLTELSEEHWLPVGQGFRDMSPRIEEFETALLEERIRHGSHPLLNMASSNAVVIYDPAKNRKLEKAKSSARIDPIVAAVMAAYGFSDLAKEGESKGPAPVTESSFFFM